MKGSKLVIIRQYIRPLLSRVKAVPGRIAIRHGERLQAGQQGVAVGGAPTVRITVGVIGITG